MKSKFVEDEKKMDEYLNRFFAILKKTEGVMITRIHPHFNTSEMRLLGEIVSADCEGKRIISTRLAEKLGITRSAVSQIVNKLEERNIVMRVPDDIDKKIAYIEFTDMAKKKYKEERNEYAKFIKKVIEQMGEDEFLNFIKYSEKFINTVEDMTGNEN